MKIFIGCSSSNDINNKYILENEKLLSGIFENNHSLIFGAANSGLMGLAYNIAKDNNRNVIGIAPEIYKDDFKNLDCDQELVTKSVNERTDLMIDESDLMLFLPGGIGTIYEFMTAVERKRSKKFDKPIILYNCNGFFDDLISMLEHIYQEKFTSSKVKSNYIVIEDYTEVINYIYDLNSSSKVYVK